MTKKGAIPPCPKGQGILAQNLMNKDSIKKEKIEKLKNYRKELNSFLIKSLINFILLISLIGLYNFKIVETNLIHFIIGGLFLYECILFKNLLNYREVNVSKILDNR